MKRFRRGINQSSTGSDSGSSSETELHFGIDNEGIYLIPRVEKVIRHASGNKITSEGQRSKPPPIKEVIHHASGLKVTSGGKRSKPIPKNISLDDDLLDDDDGHLNFNHYDVLDKYIILGFLGKGKFSRVVKARNIETLQTCALKIVRNTDKCRRSGIIEVEMLEKLRGLDPNVEKLWIKILDRFEFGGHICIALELTGCSLYDFMRDNKFQPFTLSQTRQIAYQICQSVNALHEKSIVHADLNLENICFLSSDFSYGIRSLRNTSFRQVKNPTIRIIDFGSAELCHGLINKTNIQTSNYCSPEVAFGIGWSMSCDVWSIACIIFELYHGFQLFPADEDEELADVMQEVLGQLPDMFFSHRPMMQQDIVRKDRAECKPLHKYMKASDNDNRQLFDLLENLLKYIPNERMALTEALDHPFFALCREGIMY